MADESSNVTSVTSGAAALVTAKSVVPCILPDVVTSVTSVTSGTHNIHARTRTSAGVGHQLVTGYTGNNPAHLTSNATLALYYAESGQRVLPVCPRRKQPLVEFGFKSASTDPTQVQEWWHRWPSALPALACSTFWVIDVDVRSGSPGLSDVMGNLAPLLNQAGLVVATPSGGRHFYFARTPGVAIPPRASDIAPGIDTRGHGDDGEPRSYIIAPGAVRADGRGYQIMRGAPDEIATAPHRLLALATFNARERATIAQDKALRSRLNEAAADCWRAIFDERQVEKARAARPVTIANCTETAISRQAEADLQECADKLTNTRDGRKVAIFKAAASVGKYVAHGALSEDRVTAELIGAWHACGGAKDHGERYGHQQIAAGLRISMNDPLPRIARRFVDAGAIRHD